MKMISTSNEALIQSALVGSPVTAAQPSIGGVAPARPPITMFWEVARFR